MALKLKDRLARIRDTKKNELTAQEKAGPDLQALPTLEGWEQSGYLTVKKVVENIFPFELPAAFPAALPILIPDVSRYIRNNKQKAEISPADLLFFDLETTGLSGGAGTLAFLAAFGKLIPLAKSDTAKAAAPAAGLRSFSLRITQYLLLDYPGECDFLDALLAEFSKKPLVVSYNGKCFDSQILKSRCLVNRLPPPEFFHADLLHPARRLWKRLLENCSQGTIEEKALGLDRSGDISGAFAPEIWFDFLRSGKPDGLLRICDHNRRDIQGLAYMFAAMSQIADNPVAALKKIKYDTELLALYWRDALRRNVPPGSKECEALQDAGSALLRYAADNGAGRAAFAYAKDLLRAGVFDQGRERLYNVAEGNFPLGIKAAALRSLAIDSERRLGNVQEALELATRGMELLPPDSACWKEFSRRLERLRRKIG
jgi:uncharacterized protein YprB with RNaseH-like and TPR domain